MRGRYPGPSGISYSFGPGPWTPAIRAIIITCVVAFVLVSFQPILGIQFGLTPQYVIERLAVWQLITYLFVHGGVTHLLFNMLMLYLMGVELERMWGSKFFAKFYFVCGLGAALTQVLLGLIPGTIGNLFYDIRTIGASGAIYGVLLAYALYFPHRQILMFFLFPIPAKYFVMILAGISLYFTALGGGGVAHTAHLGGLVTGYLYLKRPRLNLFAEIQYRYLKWRINRTRRKFDVYSGGRRDDINRRVH